MAREGNYILDSGGAPWVESPTRLFSLWDVMKQIILAETFDLGNSAHSISRIFDPLQIRFTDGPDIPIDDGLRASFLGRYREANAFCDALDLPVSKKSCLEIIRLLESRDTAKGRWLHVPTTEFAKRLSAELESKKCLLLRPDRFKYFDAADLFGEKVSARFPAAKFDIEEAGKCFALGRNTASVLHLMRVLEIGLRALAESLKVPFEEKDWRGVLNALQKEWKRRENLRRKPTNWKRDRQFYSEAFVEFGYLKDAWRNYAMHAKERYDEDRSETILLHVKGFMNHLATKLKE